MSEKECVLGLEPIMRICASCEKLHDCELGKRIVLGNDSLTFKILQLDWNPTTKELEKMTYEQLCEVNAAYDERKRLEDVREMNRGLTVGAYDSQTATWKADDPRQKVVDLEEAFEKTGFTAGRWNARKRRFE